MNQEKFNKTYASLNEKQKQAHDMIVSSCISTEESSTDIGGKGILIVCKCSSVLAVAVKVMSLML